SAPICASNQWLLPPPRAPPYPTAVGPLGQSHLRAAADAASCLAWRTTSALPKFSTWSFGHPARRPIRLYRSQGAQVALRKELAKVWPRCPPPPPAMVRHRFSRAPWSSPPAQARHPHPRPPFYPSPSPTPTFPACSLGRATSQSLPMTHTAPVSP